jgi:predicted nucleic acid-binding protein
MRYFAVSRTRYTKSARRLESAKKWSSTTLLPGAVVADANVLLASVIGGRAGLVLTASNAPTCFATDTVRDEVRKYIPILAARRKLIVPRLLLSFATMPERWHGPESYGLHEAEARRRLLGRDENDWPTRALALAFSLPVWSQDKDFEMASIKVYTTGYLLNLIQGENQF